MKETSFESSYAFYVLQTLKKMYLQNSLFIEFYSRPKTNGIENSNWEVFVGMDLLSLVKVCLARKVLLTLSPPSPHF